MSWQKFISAILHPVVMPTTGILMYFLAIPNTISIKQQIYLLSIVFLTTYILPVLSLIFLKLTGKINSFNVSTIQERKIPLFIMMCIFLMLGIFFSDISIVRDLSYLFFGTLLGLMIVYLLFFIKYKTSLHLLSMGSAIGFFIVLQLIYHISLLSVILVFILFSGLLATSRLDLKAHTPKEVYMGFFTGLLSQLIIYYSL